MAKPVVKRRSRSPVSARKPKVPTAVFPKRPRLSPVTHGCLNPEATGFEETPTFRREWARQLKQALGAVPDGLKLTDLSGWPGVRGLRIGDQGVLESDQVAMVVASTLGRYPFSWGGTSWKLKPGDIPGPDGEHICVRPKEGHLVEHLVPILLTAPRKPERYWTLDPVVEATLQKTGATLPRRAETLLRETRVFLRLSYGL